MLQNLTEKERI